MKHLAIKHLMFAVVLLLLAGSAEAQLGVVNPGALPPTSTAQPFGNDPHPFNNLPPWSPVVRILEVAAQTTWLPVEVVQPGSLPPIIEYRSVTLPGYRITEMVGGYISQAHWGMAPTNGVYYPTFFPPRFIPK